MFYCFYSRYLENYGLEDVMHWCAVFQLWRSSANVTLLTNNVPSTGLTSFYHEATMVTLADCEKAATDWV